MIMKTQRRDLRLTGFPYQRAVGLVLLAWIALTPRLLIADPAEPGSIRVPTEHKEQVFVLVDESGAAALKLESTQYRSNESGNGVAMLNYQWRYRPRSGQEEQSGKGKAFAKLIDHKVAHGKFDVLCGPMELEWKHADSKAGFLVVNPAVIGVHPIVGDKFETDGKNTGVNLDSYLHPDPKSEKQHAAAEEKYEGPDSEVFIADANIAMPAVYNSEFAYVVANRNGIAVFQFGKAFDRTPDEDTKHHGVAYRYTFHPRDANEIEQGDDEVYELYVKGQYSQGRLNIQAGRIFLQWSVGGQQGGWLYYDPTYSRVWKVAKGDVDRLVDVLKESPER